MSETKTSIETWKDIPSYEGIYQISDFGNVKSFKYGKEKLLKPGTNGQGYLKVDLCKEGEMKTKSVHQLAAEVFLGHKSDGYNGLIVDHKNNIKTDNRLENLQLVTARHNSSKDRKVGTSKYTGVHWNKATSKWKAQIQINGKVKYIGLFTCELAASQAYKNELKQINKK
jgi:hypothetical protein